MADDTNDNRWKLLNGTAFLPFLDLHEEETTPTPVPPSNNGILWDSGDRILWDSGDILAWG